MDQRYAIGNFITSLRQEKGLTQKDLGELLGVTDKAVSKWETGAALPRMETLRNLSVLLNCTVEEILSGKRLSEKPGDALVWDEACRELKTGCDACNHKYDKLRFAANFGINGESAETVCRECGAILHVKESYATKLYSFAVRIIVLVFMTLTIIGASEITAKYVSVYVTETETKLLERYAMRDAPALMWISVAVIGLCVSFTLYALFVFAKGVTTLVKKPVIAGYPYEKLKLERDPQPDTPKERTTSGERAENQIDWKDFFKSDWRMYLLGFLIPIVIRILDDRSVRSVLKKYKAGSVTWSDYLWNLIKNPVIGIIVFVFAGYVFVSAFIAIASLRKSKKAAFWSLLSLLAALSILALSAWLFLFYLPCRPA